MGKLFVIEGVDGSGKATQTEKLYERLVLQGISPLKVTFPDYESDSSVIVKKYLSGELGQKADSVLPKAASTFFAVDRYVSYKTRWEDFYKKNGVVIADRYTTSNMIHQAAKIEEISEKEEFLNWLEDFEYNIYGLPRPSVTIFLDVPPSIGYEISKNRKNKMNGLETLDIHESDREYIKRSYDNSKFIAQKYNWKTINCVKEGKMRTVDDIHNEVYNIIKGYL